MTTLVIHPEDSRSWKIIHILASDASLLVLGIHFALHFKWVVSSLKRYLFSSVIRVFQLPRAGNLTLQPVRIDGDR